MLVTNDAKSGGTENTKLGDTPIEQITRAQGLAVFERRRPLLFVRKWSSLDPRRRSHIRVSAYGV